jgi:hypothetical protein
MAFSPQEVQIEAFSDGVYPPAVTAWLANPTSANLYAAMVDKTGNGLLVFRSFATTATNASALTLTVSSGTTEILTGTNGHVVILPAVSTLSLGHTIEIFNEATNTLGPAASGTLTKVTGTGDATITFTSVAFAAINTYAGGSTYTFTLSPSANATAGAVYSNNGQLFTVNTTISGGASLVTASTGVVIQSSGNNTVQKLAPGNRITLVSNATAGTGATVWNKSTDPKYDGQTLTVERMGFLNSSAHFRNDTNITGSNGLDLCYLNNGRFRMIEVGVLGTNDVFFQGLPATGSGYTYMEDYGGAGLILGTGQNTPVIFRPNRSGTLTRGRVTGGGDFLFADSTITTTASAKVHIAAATEQLRVGYDTSNYYKTTVSSAGAVTFDAVGASAGFTFSDAVTLSENLTIADAKNIVLNTTTGTKMGTATNQKWAVWNATPDVQPTNAIAAAAFVANTSAIANDTATFGGYTVGQVVAALKRIGLLA